jgi:hypothetical protein
MHLTTAQLAIHLICGESLPTAREESLPERVRRGHDFLVSITGEDFGYDLKAWHNHLKESRQGGYTYGRNIVLPRIMKAALQSTEWHEAVRTQTAVASDRKDS